MGMEIMMKMPRFWTFQEMYVMTTDQTAATTKGGTVRSCTSMVVYRPRVLITVGMKVERPATET